MMRLINIIFLLFVLQLCVVAQKQNTSAFEKYTATLPGSEISFTMTPVPAGKFMMGSPADEKGRKKDEGPQKEISIKAFWMGIHEVTFEEYNRFFEDEDFDRNNFTDAITRPSPPYLDFTLGMGKEGGFPANSMQQLGALMYCKWLYHKTGIFYRLPTEAEWEYACRAGSDDIYPFGDNTSALSEYAWYEKNSTGKYHPVGQLKPNAWGLYDMLGNVAEWTLDQYDSTYFTRIGDSTNNPVINPTRLHPRTVKGGNYEDKAEQLRPAARLMSALLWNRRDPQLPKSKWWNADAPFVGFRIIRPLNSPSKEEIEKFFNHYLSF